MKKLKEHQNTDIKLYIAFLDLIKNCTRYEISVDDICKQSEIHHQTFYHHYESKKDFYKSFFLNYLFQNKNSIDESLVQVFKIFCENVKIYEYMKLDSLYMDVLIESIIDFCKIKSDTLSEKLIYDIGGSFFLFNYYYINQKNIDEFFKIIKSINF